jgi:hypothetical protein
VGSIPITRSSFSCQLRGRPSPRSNLPRFISQRATVKLLGFSPAGTVIPHGICSEGRANATVFGKASASRG